MIVHRKQFGEISEVFKLNVGYINYLVWQILHLCGLIKDYLTSKEHEVGNRKKRYAKITFNIWFRIRKQFRLTSRNESN